MVRRRPGRWAVLAAVALVLLSSCADDGGNDTGATTTTGPDTSTSSTSAPGDGSPDGDDPDDEEVELPETLTELIGPSPTLDPGAAQQWYLDRERERQEVVEACMDEAGFDYEPVEPAWAAERPWDPSIAWASDEWVDTYGLGISTLRYPDSLVGPELVGYLDEVALDAADPNAEIADALDEDERDAWEAARVDCEASGWRDIQSTSLAAAFRQRFADELAEMYEELADDPRYLELHEEIRRCIVGSGGAEPDLAEAVADIEARLAQIDHRIGSDRADPEALTELAEIQADEIAMARTMADCGGRILSRNEAFVEIVAEYEAAFIDEHADDLRSFLRGAAEG